MVCKMIFSLRWQHAAQESDKDVAKDVSLHLIYSGRKNYSNKVQNGFVFIAREFHQELIQSIPQKKVCPISRVSISSHPWGCHILHLIL